MCRCWTHAHRTHCMVLSTSVLPVTVCNICLMTFRIQHGTDMTLSCDMTGIRALRRNWRIAAIYPFNGLFIGGCPVPEASCEELNGEWTLERISLQQCSFTPEKEVTGENTMAQSCVAYKATHSLEWPNSIVTKTVFVLLFPPLLPPRLRTRQLKRNILLQVKRNILFAISIASVSSPFEVAW